LAARARLSPKDLDGVPLIVPPRPSPHRERLALAFAAAGAELAIALEASGWEVMLRLVRARVGAAIVNDFCDAPGGTRAVELRGLDAIEYRLVRRRDLSDRAARLRDAIAGRG
jgi:DNA-binding transcriptional LysR family regulator